MVCPCPRIQEKLGLEQTLPHNLCTLRHVLPELRLMLTIDKLPPPLSSVAVYPSVCAF